MGFKADVGFLITFAFEAIYNFFRWTPFGPNKCRIEGSLDGKVCVITGATSGIGRVVAKELAVKGESHQIINSNFLKTSILKSVFKISSGILRAGSSRC